MQMKITLEKLIFLLIKVLAINAIPQALSPQNCIGLSVRKRCYRYRQDCKRQGGHCELLMSGIFALPSDPEISASP